MVRYKKDGHEVYTWLNGDTYDGEWKNDKMEGHGVYTYVQEDIPIRELAQKTKKDNENPSSRRV